MKAILRPTGRLPPTENDHRSWAPDLNLVVTIIKSGNVSRWWDPRAVSGVSHSFFPVASPFPPASYFPVERRTQTRVFLLLCNHQKEGDEWVIGGYWSLVTTWRRSLGHHPSLVGFQAYKGAGTPLPTRFSTPLPSHFLFLWVNAFAFFGVDHCTFGTGFHFSHSHSSLSFSNSQLRSATSLSLLFIAQLLLLYRLVFILLGQNDPYRQARSSLERSPRLLCCFRLRSSHQQEARSPTRALP